MRNFWKFVEYYENNSIWGTIFMVFLFILLIVFAVIVLMLASIPTVIIIFLGVLTFKTVQAYKDWKSQ